MGTVIVLYFPSLYQSVFSLYKEAPVAKVAEMKKAFENTVWVCDIAKSFKLGFDCEYNLEAGIRDFLLKAKYD